MTNSAPTHPDDLVDLALGIEDPARRPALLSHLAGCRICREELASMADLSDRLVALAPAAEPPPGFEQRVLGQVAAHSTAEPAEPDTQPATLFASRAADATGPATSRAADAAGPATRRAADTVGPATSRAADRPRQAPGRPARARPTGAGRRRLPTVLWAAAAAAVAAAVAVPATLAARSGPPRSPVHEAVLTSSQGPVGDVIVDYDGTPWMSMWVHAWSGRSLTCQLVTASGKAVTVGVFVPGPQSGYWAAAIPPAADHAGSARLIDSAGQVLATAKLP